VLALDCWEHAFMIDYGTKKPDYLAAFFRNVNWNVVNERYARSGLSTPEPVRVRIGSLEQGLIRAGR
jgi:hypothetical protein